MTRREWKPGEVGMVTDDHGNMRVAVHGGLNPRMKHNWHYDEAGIGRILQPRPLLVIDPEDREQMARVESAIAEACGWTRLVDDRRVDAFQQAFRELANPKPPKPAEPMGLGAVVEDEDGSLLTRAKSDSPRPWVAEGGAWFAWDDIDVATVHSKGRS